MWKIPFLILCLTVWFQGALPAVEVAARRASEEEISRLFEFGLNEPAKARIVADIVTRERAWTPEEVAAEARSQGSLLAGRGSSSSGTLRAELARSNAIARATSESGSLTSRNGTRAKNFVLTKTMKR